MKNFIKNHKGIILIIIGILFNFVESLYFGIGTSRGFNLKPQSIAEFICDDISTILIILGGYLVGLKIARSKRVEYVDPSQIRYR